MEPTTTPKQAALIDVIDSCSWAGPGCPDTMTTAEAARLAGCDVDSAWHALAGLEWLVFYPPENLTAEDRSRHYDQDDMPARLRAECMWSLPDDSNWDDDDAEWFGHRIEAAKRTGIQTSIEYWETRLRDECQDDWGSEDAQAQLEDDGLGWAVRK
jgi:hypothetical protein